MPQVFLSYRRDDTGLLIGRIADWLEREFGQKAVFTDIDGIPPAVDFRQHLTSTIRSCTALVAIIGPKWLVRSGCHNPRLADPGDFVRIEIETALAAGIPVLPLLVGNASMPEPAVLPETMRELAFRQATTLNPGPDFRAHMERLIVQLKHLGVRRAAIAESLQSEILSLDDPLVAKRISLRPKDSQGRFFSLSRATFGYSMKNFANPNSINYGRAQEGSFLAYLRLHPSVAYYAILPPELFDCAYALEIAGKVHGSELVRIEGKIERFPVCDIEHETVLLLVDLAELRENNE